MKTRIASLLLAGLSLTLTACMEENQQTQNAPPPPPAVDVSQPLKQSITEWDNYIGRFEAIDRVDVRSRVTGYILEKRFKDGQIVTKGDVLFVIDPRSFEFQLTEAQADYNLAVKELERARSLRTRGTVAQEQLDRRLQEFRAAEARLSLANLDIEFTEIKAPIDGRISDAFSDAGNLVRENDTVLTRVVSLNPIHFEFEASQTQLLKYLRLDRSGDRPSSAHSANPIFIKLQDEKTYAHAGRMDFVDNIVDPGTGTIQGRALVSNDEGLLFPGLFGRARLIGSGQYDALLLPERAIQTDQGRKFVYVVDGENKSGRVYIEIGPVLDNGFVPIRSGLSGDENVVIAGIQRIRFPQQPVTPESKPLEWVPIETMPDPNTVPSLLQIMQKTSNDGVQ